MKYKKIVIVLILLLLFSFTIISTCVNATVNVNEYEPVTLPLSSNSNLMKLGRNIFSGISIVGIVISVIALMLIGIKFMTGSVQEKAEYKKSMIPYTVGIIFLFCTSTIIGLIANIVKNIG